MAVDTRPTIRTDMGSASSTEEGGAAIARVVIADDHAVLRSGLTAALSAGFPIDVVGVAASGPEAVQLYRATRPDAALFDLHLPRPEDGLDAIAHICSFDPAARVIVLSAFGDPIDVDRSLEAGAIGYILKDAAPSAIAAAIDSAIRGGSPLDSRVAAVAIQRLANLRDRRVLSLRDQRMIELVAEGLSNADIARVLGLAHLTVKARLTDVYKRLRVRNREEAAAWAKAHGLRGNQPRP